MVTTSPPFRLHSVTLSADEFAEVAQPEILVTFAAEYHTNATGSDDN